MTTLTISVASAEDAGPRVTMMVEVDSRGARVEEITVRMGADGAGFPDQITTVDFGRVWEMAVAISQGRLLGPPLNVAVVPEPPIEDQSADEKASPAPPPHVKVPSGLPADLGVMYWRLGSVARVAAHYDVPRHVASGWIRQLRKGGRDARIDGNGMDRG